MSAGTTSLQLDDDGVKLAPSTTPVIRFLKGAELLGQCPVNPGETIVDHAEACGISLPTNCTSGTCGTCMVSLILGESVEHNKLVSRNSSNDAAGGKDISEALRHRNQHIVSSLVAQRVVDVLEPVNVDEENGWLPAFGPSTYKCIADVSEHQRPVWQTGECVGLCRKDEFSLRLCVCAHSMNYSSSYCSGEYKNGNCAYCSVGIVGWVGECEHKYRNGERRCGDDKSAKQWALLRDWTMCSKR